MQYWLNDREKAIQQIVDVSIRSAQAKNISIFEIGNLNDLLSKEQAEQIRKEFVEYNTPIRQITNHRSFVNWTEQSGMTQNLQVRYVPAETMKIDTEILIFDDTVAMYRLEPSPIYTEITDQKLANEFRQMFDLTWNTGDALLLSSDGSTLTKQYAPLWFTVGDLPVVVYPAKDDGQLEQAFARNQPGVIEAYVQSILSANTEEYKSADMIIAVIWNLSEQKEIPCCDIWKVNKNTYSDDSGLLYDVRVYKDTQRITDMGVASGNTSIVITAEEMLLRELILDKKLSFKEAANRDMYHARFPAGYFPAESFYTN